MKIFALIISKKALHTRWKLDIFLGNLKKKEYWEDLEIVIMSDDAARITFEEERLLSVIFAMKTKKISPGLYDDDIITNHLFYKFNN